MAVNARGVLTARVGQNPNSLYFYISKIDPKWAKNDHFRPKNALIDLKIGHILYLGGFYDFSNFHRKSSKIARFLAEKTHFFADSAKKIEKKTSTEIESTPSIFDEMAQIFIYMIYDVFTTNFHGLFFCFAFFSDFMGS